MSGGAAGGPGAAGARPPPPAEGDRPEQTFFKDPAIDRVLGVAMALAGEVWVLRDRVRRLERALAASGALPQGALDAAPSADAAAADAADRDAFVRHLMQNLLGVQQSKGPL